MKCVVNSFELLLYYCISLSLVIWSMYKLYEAQTEIFSKHHHLLFSLKDLSAGWTFLDRKVNLSDKTWSAWLCYIQTSWIYLIVQFLISEFLRQFYASTLKYWYILSGMFFTSYYVGLKTTSMILIQPLVYFILMLCGGKRIIVWVISLLLLIYYESTSFSNYLWHIFDYRSQERVNLSAYAIGWTGLRCISYCLQFIEKQEKVEKSGNEIEIESKIQSVINLLSYVWYLPVLYLGPIMLYEEFENSFLQTSETLLARLKRFTVDVIVFLTYSLLLELCHHFIYFSAMYNNNEGMKLIKQLSASALAGAGMWMHFEFYTKYVIIYGIASAFARLDNNDSPPTPRCVYRIHVYSEMWRYFDVGLHKFNLKYIAKPCYIALCKYTNLPKNICKEIAALGPFAFMALWHGFTSGILIWCSFGYIGVLLEHICRALSTTALYRKFKDKVLKTKAMEVRFISVLCSPLLLASLISSYYFDAGTEVGHSYIELLTRPDLHNYMLLMLAMYCWCQGSISLLDVPSRTDHRRPGAKVN